MPAVSVHHRENALSKKDMFRAPDRYREAVHCRDYKGLK